MNRIVEAGVSLNRLQSFLLCEEHLPVSTADSNGVFMVDLSAAYESRKPRLDGVDIDAKTKEAAEAKWEVSLLKAQLEEAEQHIKSLSTEKESFVKRTKMAMSALASKQDSDEWEDVSEGAPREERARSCR